MSGGLFSRARGFDRRLWVLTAGWFVNALGFSMVFPFLMVYLKEKRHFDVAVVGLVYLAMGAARITGVLLAGFVVDRIGRRKIMVGAPALRAVIYLILAWAIHRWASLREITTLLTVASFVGSFFQTAADTYVADLVGPEQRSDAYAVLRVGLNLGWMTGPAAGAFLARTPYSLLFGVTAATAMVLAALAWIFCHETLDVAARRSRDGGAGPGFSPAVYLQSPAFLAFCFMTLLLFLGSSQLVSTLAAYARSGVGIEKWQLGMLYTINGLVVVVLQLPVNAALRRVRLRTRMGAGALVYALGYGLLGRATCFGHMAGCIAIISCAEMLVMPSSISIATRFAPAGAKGRFVGLFSMMRGLGFSVGPYIGCKLFAYFEPFGATYAIWAILPWITVAGAVGIFSMSHPAMAEAEGAERPGA